MIRKLLAHVDKAIVTLSRRTYRSPAWRRSAGSEGVSAIVLLSAFVLVVTLALTGCGATATESPTATQTLPATQTSVAPSPSPTVAPSTPTTVPPTPASELPVIGTLTLSGSGCNLDIVEDPLGSGGLSIAVTNEKASEFIFDTWKLDEGYTYGQFAEFIEEERQLAESGQPFTGPPSQVGDLSRFSVPAGDSEYFSRFYSPGTYAIVCFQRGLPWFIELVGPIEVE